MAQIVLALIATLIPIVLIVLARRRPRPRSHSSHLSPVSQQHLELFQGGKLSDTMLHATKSAFRRLLRRGELQRVEASLGPGTSYAVQVRALTEIGTDAAGQILERQLHRRLSADPIEQAWYWLDLASGLRRLNRQTSLPHLMGCAASAELPLGYFLAAETTCFPGFRQSLKERADKPLAALQRALEGLRFGVQPQAFVAGRYAELIDIVWQNNRRHFDPAVVRVFCAALRWLRRCPYAVRLLDENERDEFDEQVHTLETLADSLREYLAAAGPALAARLGVVALRDTASLLQALTDQRYDAGAAIVALLDSERFEWSPDVVEALAHSRLPVAGQALSGEMRRRLQRLKWKRFLPWVRRTKVASDPLLPSLLAALKNHPGADVESLLTNAADDRDPAVRRAAVASLGCREALSTKALAIIRAARSDPDSEVAMTAEAALCRLGEFRALQRFRQRLAAEMPETVHSTIDWIARSGLALLWPELDCLADAESPDIAFHACEALEQMREQMSTNLWA